MDKPEPVFRPKRRKNPTLWGGTYLVGSPGFLKALKRAQWDSVRVMDVHTQRDVQASFRRKNTDNKV